MPPLLTRFVSAWPSTLLRAEPSGRSRAKTQCLWGDWVGVRDPTGVDGWLPVRTRGRDGWLRAEEVSPERLLEVNFVDIGQGDGTFIVTPDDRMLIIDAGQTRNMYRFLRWRFNLRSSRPRVIDTALITHPDADHYAGFQPLLDDPRFQFKRLLHNGIVERTGEARLGPSITVNGQKYLTDLPSDGAALHALLGNSAARGRMAYPKLLWTALSNGRVDEIRAVASGEVLDERMLNGRPFRWSVLAPVRESVNGAPALRWFDKAPGPTGGGDVGKTKNGHSVVTLLRYGAVRILLGGDLNTSAEAFLLDRYGARTDVFACDVAKACHHGSADFSAAFLDRVSPLATVISSGDDEPHCHPRADTLGAIGRHSRGDRPLIFSTELARSAPERIINPAPLREGILGLVDRVVQAGDDAARADARAAVQKRLETVIQRSVSMYGMITVRTDGDRVLLAQRLERGTTSRKWDVYKLEREQGVLRYVHAH